MASIAFGEMADCDWLRSTFSGPLRKNTRMILKQNSKTNRKFENYNLVCY
jgi:hypothetical protein